MQLTQGTEYAIRSALFLSRLGPEGSSFAAEMSRRLRIPASFLAKVLTSLVRAGVVESHRGAKGGYRLAGRPEKIRLSRIIEAVEGPMAIARCLRPAPSCRRSKRCGMKKIFKTAQDRIVEVLDGVTLADLANDDTA